MSEGRFELSKSFRFEAAHRLSGTKLGSASETIHGHSFRAVVVLIGAPDQHSGMIVDLGLVSQAIADVQASLDHRLLNDVRGLGPPTLENLSRYICRRLEAIGNIVRVEVHRDSCGEACAYIPSTGQK